jgi:sugar lactone lactonase YvrE
MRTHLNNKPIIAKMKTRLTALAVGLALSLSLSSHAQNVSTVLSSNLFEPNSIATDANNVAYITDGANNRIMKYNAASSSLSALAGFAGASGTNNGTGTAARFFQPAGIVYARGGLVVADSANHLLRFVTVNGVVTTLAGVWSDYGGYVNGPANTAQFSYPLGLAADNAGNIYIADSGNGAIRMLDTNNVVSTIKTGFYQPSAVAVTTNGDLWVADTRHHVIQFISTNGTMTLVAGAMNTPGTNDALVATDARFNMPSGLYLISTASGVLISDTANNTIRRIYFNNDLGNYSVETVAGQPAHAGLVDGTPTQAKFNGPVGIWPDLLNSGFYVVDRANSALRRLQTTAPQPPVADPVIGFVTFERDPQTGILGSVFNPAISAVFNNPVIIAVKAQLGTATYITYGTTPPNAFEDTIPAPNAQTGVSPTIYKGNGLSPDLTAPSIIPMMPDITMKTIGTADGRRPSAVITNRFQFKVANPSFTGDNAASFSFDDITTNAILWYTVDGSDPAPNGTNTLGPVQSSQKISIIITNDTVVKVRGFLDQFSPSEIITKTFSVSNFNANKITFGFSSGEASSDFVAAAGQRFYAPVTLTVLPGQPVYSLQFNLTVTNVGAAPAIAPNAFDFKSMLKKPLEGVSPPVYVPIPPAMFLGVASIITTNITVTNIGGFDFTNYSYDFITFTNMMFTNTMENLMGVGWFERKDQTNLYNTRSQDLIRYSMAHNTMFQEGNRQVVIGGYSFVVPSAATPGQQYQIAIGRPSGTEDGIANPVFIQTPTNGSFGAGSMNAIKNVTVGSRAYIVGDSVPFRWFNAGDFGDTNLNNADIMDLFQGVVYTFNRPPEGSDFFDSMDSSDGVNSGVLDGNDTQINSIQYGDGKLGVDDIYVTFRRSLDPGLKWFARYWSNGVLNVMEVPNVTSGSMAPVTQQSSPAPRSLGAPRFVNVAPDDVQGAAGATIQVPVRASISGNLPIRVMALNVQVQPLDGSPALTVPVIFNPASGLGAPTVSSSTDPKNYAAAWLNSTVAGVSGTNLLGTLTVTIPTNATASSAWVVHFEHLSVSPNGIGLFPLTIQDALITTTDRSSSSWGDGISDAWRLRWFGSVSNILSGADLDPDHDGHSNLAEFKAGTNPLDGVSHLALNCDAGAPRSAVSFPSVFGKQYTVECSSSLFSGSWSVIGTNLSGTGQTIQFADPNPTPGTRFYRVKVQ